MVNFVFRDPIYIGTLAKNDLIHNEIS